MSVDKNYYVIAGYDLSGMKTDKFNDWQWSDEGEKYVCNKVKGKIQLFDDLMSGSHLYFGYVLAIGDMYECETSKFKVDDVNTVYNDVKAELVKLIEIGIIAKDPCIIPEYQIIAFEECS